MKVVIATANKNKIREIIDKYAAIPHLELLSLSDYPGMPEVIEDGETFSANALKKAHAVAHHAQCASMADDSGLVVDALGGRPGVFSARYGGPGLADTDRNRLLLDEMTGVTDNERTARFVCVIAIALPDGTAYTAEGSCEGTITRAPRGTGGFGYDPVFIPAGMDRTMAELRLEEKNHISHRAIALERAREIIARLAGAR